MQQGFSFMDPFVRSSREMAGQPVNLDALILQWYFMRKS